MPRILLWTGGGAVVVGVALGLLGVWIYVLWSFSRDRP